MEAVLSAHDLSYGPPRQPRVRRIDLQLTAADRLGLLGLNGAGKSTLLQLLAGVLPPSAGEVRVLGRRLDADGHAARRQIGYLPQRVPAYPELSVRENLAWAGQLHGLRGRPLREAIATVLAQVELGNVADRLAGRLSAGMLQRLGLAQAILHRPRVLILDEPTASLDPLQTEQIRDLLGRLGDDVSLVVATHLLDDVLQLCGRVILLDQGRQVAEHPVTADIDLLAHLRAGLNDTGLHQAAR